VVVFTDDGSFLRRIGTDSITNFPNGIDISDAGDVLVGDSHGNRFHVAVFQRDGSLIGKNNSKQNWPIHCIINNYQGRKKNQLYVNFLSRGQFCCVDGVKSALLRALNMLIG